MIRCVFYLFLNLVSYEVVTVFIALFYWIRAKPINFDKSISKLPTFECWYIETDWFRSEPIGHRNESSGSLVGNESSNVLLSYETKQKMYHQLNESINKFKDISIYANKNKIINKFFWNTFLDILQMFLEILNYNLNK